VDKKPRIDNLSKKDDFIQQKHEKSTGFTLLSPGFQQIIHKGRSGADFHCPTSDALFDGIQILVKSCDFFREITFVKT
jgi:hypothetical protein